MALELTFNIFKKFYKNDFIEFNEFLQSSFLNKRKVLCEVFKVISDNKDLILLNQSDEMISEIRKVTGFSDKTIQNYISQLNTNALKYFMFKSVMNDEVFMNIKLNEYLLKNEYLELLKKNIKDNERFFKEGVRISQDYFLYVFFNSDCKKSLIITEKNVYTNQNDIIPVLNLLIHQYQASVFYFVNEIINRENKGISDKLIYPLNIKKIYSVLEEAIHCLDKNSLQFRYIKLVNLLYNAFDNFNDEKNYFLLKDYFMKFKDNLDNELMYLYFSILINYVAIINDLKKNTFFRIEELELREKFIEEEYYRYNMGKYMTAVTFQNYVLRCYAAGQFEKLLSFIEKYSSKLNPSEAEDIVNFGLAFYYYGIGERKKSLQCINSLSKKPVGFKYHLYGLELKLHFEQLASNERSNNDINQAVIERAVETIEILLKKEDSLTKSMKKNYYLMLKYYKQFIYLYFKPDFGEKYVERFSYVKHKIEKENNFTLKKWLLIEIDKIAGRQSAVASD
jgi:hypothetical protein